MNEDYKVISTPPLEVLANDVEADVVWGRYGFSMGEGGAKSGTLKIVDAELPGDAWQNKQGNALAEYETTHVHEHVSSVLNNIYKLFGTYIASALHGPDEKEEPKVLDIGCGIGRMRPLYMRRLVGRAQYYGLDAFDMNLERDYPFICSRLESFSKMEKFHHQFDAFIFGTSLDHFENHSVVADAVRKLAAPGALVFFWIGLHDADLVAREEGALALQKVFDGSGLMTMVGRFIRFAFWKFPKIAHVIFSHKRKLSAGQGLDDLHFWYFRERDLPGLLAEFGEITDITLLPGTNSVFCACRILNEKPPGG